MNRYQSGHNAMPQDGDPQHERVEKEIRDAYERGRRDGAADEREAILGICEIAAASTATTARHIIDAIRKMGGDVSDPTRIVWCGECHEHVPFAGHPCFGEAAR